MARSKWKRISHGHWRREDSAVASRWLRADVWHLYQRIPGHSSRHIFTGRTLKECRDYADTHYPMEKK